MTTMLISPSAGMSSGNRMTSTRPAMPASTTSTTESKRCAATARPEDQHEHEVDAHEPERADDELDRPPHVVLVEDRRRR